MRVRCWCVAGIVHWYPNQIGKYEQIIGVRMKIWISVWNDIRSAQWANTMTTYRPVHFLIHQRHQWPVCNLHGTRKQPSDGVVVMSQAISIFIFYSKCDKTIHRTLPPTCVQRLTMQRWEHFRKRDRDAMSLWRAETKKPKDCWVKRWSGVEKNGKSL